MARIVAFTAVSLILAGCQQQEANDAPLLPEPEVAAGGAMPPATSTGVAGPRWQTIGGSEGAHARLTAPDGTLIMSVGCRMNSGRIDVAVPGFERVGSEDRLSFGFDDDPMALVVDLGAPGPGVQAGGTVPENLGKRILAARSVGVSYGQQNLGPFPSPTGYDAQSLAIACTPGTEPKPPKQ